MGSTNGSRGSSGSQEQCANSLQNQFSEDSIVLPIVSKFPQCDEMYQCTDPRNSINPSKSQYPFKLDSRFSQCPSYHWYFCLEVRGAAALWVRTSYQHGFFACFLVSGSWSPAKPKSCIHTPNKRGGWETNISTSTVKEIHKLGSQKEWKMLTTVIF